MNMRTNSALSLDCVPGIYSFRSQSAQLKRTWENSRCIYPKSKTFIKQNDNFVNKNEINDFKVKLNIGGIRFETFNSTLTNIPGTRLSKLSKSDHNYDLVRDEYFFDRSPVLFEYILNLLRTGELHIPSNECGSSVSKELTYWNIDQAYIPPCCWLSFSKTKENKSILTRFDKNFFENLYSSEQLEKSDSSKFKLYRNYLWSMIKYPYIFLSFRPWYVDAVFIKNHSHNKNYMVSGYPSPYFKISDTICIVFFTLEFLIELVCCPSIKQYFRSMTNLLCIFSLIFYYIEIVSFFIRPNMACFTPTVCSENFERVLSVLQLWRMFRVLRLFKNFTGMRVMAYTLKYSGKELVLIVSMLLIGVAIFGSLIYAAEGDPESLDGFYNIPISLWFAITTMTTVGFGDRVPTSTPGFIVGSLCALSGVLVVAFTVPIAVSNFTLFYTYTHSRINYFKNK
ncbi:potassium voltage-gated channel Shaw [Brachionus plicatilis]|uniref:Potassium voltage-gated channel Shaw n=1 Tax=Brachionus plicatilis TaxID=10195 RepID=A0A3M7RXK4_BRAPC|nr:potassium voltage-gated channel Shaw [Brachionus plicatilis]